MAAAEVTISGILYDKLNRTQQQVVLIGEASLTGLGVGGGPIYPPVGTPPGIGGPPGPWPAPPIHLPPGGVTPPDPPTGPPTSPPLANWEWGWSPAYDWHPVYVPGDKPQPVPPPGSGASPPNRPVAPR